jgi:hypothetical protein
MSSSVTKVETRDGLIHEVLSHRLGEVWTLCEGKAFLWRLTFGDKTPRAVCSVSDDEQVTCLYCVRDPVFMHKGTL